MADGREVARFADYRDSPVDDHDGGRSRFLPAKADGYPWAAAVISASRAISRILAEDIFVEPAGLVFFAEQNVPTLEPLLLRSIKRQAPRVLSSHWGTPWASSCRLRSRQQVPTHLHRGTKPMPLDEPALVVGDQPGSAGSQYFNMPAIGTAESGFIRGSKPLLCVQENGGEGDSFAGSGESADSEGGLRKAFPYHVITRGKSPNEFFDYLRRRDFVVGETDSGCD